MCVGVKLRAAAARRGEKGHTEREGAARQRERVKEGEKETK